MKKWFIQILQGTKTQEYRTIKPYWTTRLFEPVGDNQQLPLKPKQYDLIIFKNGYAKDAPEMKVEFKGIKFGKFEGNKVYAIQLGKILKTENCERLK